MYNPHGQTLNFRYAEKIQLEVLPDKGTEHTSSERGDQKDLCPSFFYSNLLHQHYLLGFLLQI